MLGNRIKELRLSKGLTLDKLADLLNKRYPDTVNFNKGKLSKWENNKEEPKLSSIRLLADFYGVSIDDFYKKKKDGSREILELESTISKDNQPTSTTLSLINDTSSKLEEPRQQVVLNVALRELEQQQQQQLQQQQLTSLEAYRKRKSEKKMLGKQEWRGAISAGTGEFLGDDYAEEIELPVEMIPDDSDFCLSVNGNSMEPIFHDDDYVFISKQPNLYSGAIGAVLVNGEAFLKRVWFENNYARLESFNKNYPDIIVTEDDDFKIIGKVVM